MINAIVLWGSLSGIVCLSEARNSHLHMLAVFMILMGIAVPVIKTSALIAEILIVGAWLLLAGTMWYRVSKDIPIIRWVAAGTFILCICASFMV